MAEKLLFDSDSLDRYLNMCKISGKNYLVTVSNYTTYIDSPTLKIKFIKEEKSPKCFSAFSKIKSDIIKSNIHVDVNKSDVNYFNSNLKECKYKTIYNIDLKSAYATILFNNKLISKSTFKYLQGLEKSERLASVGMLASHKYIFEYIGNKIIKFNEKVSELESYFYFCVKKTYEIMIELSRICGTYYLFCWVDSVYYTDNSITDKLINYLKSINFNYSYEVLNNFEVIENKDHFKVNFLKKGNIKPFSIPKEESPFYKHVISKHLKTIK